MKKLFCAAIILVVAVSFAKAQSSKPYNYKLDGPFTSLQTFKVNGVCDMCKHTIESALKKSPAVYSADWDADSKLLLVKFNRLKTTPAKIEKLVASTGHDTQHVKADANAYNSLPDCCRYERKSI